MSRSIQILGSGRPTIVRNGYPPEHGFIVKVEVEVCQESEGIICFLNMS